MHFETLTTHLEYLSFSFLTNNFLTNIPNIKKQVKIITINVHVPTRKKIFLVCSVYLILLHKRITSSLRKSDEVYKSLVVHRLEEVQPPLVLLVILLMMEDIEGDESWKETSEDKRMKKSVA